MQSFKDRLGRNWQVEINVTLAKRVRNRTGVDLYKLLDDKFKKLIELLDDPITLIDVIFVLCEEQALKERISDEDFGRGLAGETVVAAKDAFFEAYIAFSQDRRRADLLRSMTSKSEGAMEIFLKEAEDEVQNLTPESMAKLLKEKFGSSPELSASTPDLLRLRNSS